MFKQFAVTVIALMLPKFGLALPQGSQIIQGDGQILVDQQNMVVNQQSALLHISHETFNVAEPESVHFNQQSANWMVINEVLSSDPTKILGKVTADGQLVIASPGGFLIGEHGSIDASGLLLTASSIQTVGENGLVTGQTNGQIVNQGELSVKHNGKLVLIAPQIFNEGNIEGHLADLKLQVADAAWVNIQGDVFSIEKTDSIEAGLIKNTGNINSLGGEVYLNTDIRTTLYETVVNNEGVISADSVFESNGEIYIDASNGDFHNQGTIHANGTAINGDGGLIEIEGQRVANSGVISASGGGNLSGNGGTVNLTGAEVVALATGSQILANGAKNAGNGGTVKAFSPETALFREGAFISAEAGQQSGNGGFVDVSGWEHIEISGAVSTNAKNGSNGQFLIDPYNVTIRDAADFNVNGGSVYTPTGDSAIINTAQLEANLQSGNVTVLTSGGGSQSGDISILNDINLDGTNGNQLTLQADGNINVQANIKDDNLLTTDQTGITMTAGGNITMIDNIVVNSSGGDINMTAGANIVVGDLETKGNNIIITAGNNIQLNGTITDSNSGSDKINLELTAAGVITLPTSMTINGDISMKGSDILDNDHHLQIHADRLAIESAVNNTTTSLNTNATELDIRLTGNQSHFTMTKSDGSDTRFIDLNNDNTSLYLADGHAHIRVNANLALQDQITILDGAADGMEAGWLYLGYAGNADFGDSAALNLTVDGSIEPGTTSDLAFNNAQLVIQQTGSLSSSNTLTFGNSATQLEVMGGDMVVDITNGSGDTSIAGSVTILPSASIRILNDTGDSVSSATLDSEINNSGVVQVASGRELRFINSDAEVVDQNTPQSPIEDSNDPGIGDEILKAVADTGVNSPSTSANDSVEQLQASTVDSMESTPNVTTAMNAMFTGCENAGKHDKRCQVKHEIEHFLGRFLIGGAMKKDEP